VDFNPSVVLNEMLTVLMRPVCFRFPRDGASAVRDGKAPRRGRGRRGGPGHRPHPAQKELVSVGAGRLRSGDAQQQTRGGCKTQPLPGCGVGPIPSRIQSVWTDPCRGG
jgi:hypothetical protein